MILSQFIFRCKATLGLLYVIWGYRAGPILLVTKPTGFPEPSMSFLLE